MGERENETGYDQEPKTMTHVPCLILPFATNIMQAQAAPAMNNDEIRDGLRPHFCSIGIAM